MSLIGDFLGALETHDADEIRSAIAAGASAIDPINGRRPIDELIGGYLRSARFAECLSVLLDCGATIDDPIVRAILLDDAEDLANQLRAAHADGTTRVVTVPSAFTSLVDVSPLHVAAEFGSARCAEALLHAGANANARATVDAHGFGGQTPLFHAVNSIYNYCRPVMELLVSAGADISVQLKGLRWGVQHDWETLLLDVTPISYAQCGLYKQFHRNEHDVYSNLAYLYQAKHGEQLTPPNVPNRYLQS